MRVINTVALAVALNACAPLHAKDDPWFARDKYMHGGFSAALGAVVAHDARSRMENCDAFRAGLTVTVGIGVSKEWIDQDFRNRGWSWRDLAWDVAGGTVGSLLASQCR